MTKRFQQNQRDKLKEHFKNHIFYRLCREVRDVFLQQYPAIIISTENLFVDAAKELDIILSDGDIDAGYCKDMWTNSLAIYREQDNTLAEVATSQAEVAMLLYTIMFGINAVNHSHYRGKLQRTLHESIHKMWKPASLYCNRNQVEGVGKSIYRGDDGMDERVFRFAIKSNRRN